MLRHCLGLIHFFSLGICPSDYVPVIMPYIYKVCAKQYTNPLILQALLITLALDLEVLISLLPLPL